MVNIILIFFPKNTIHVIDLNFRAELCCRMQSISYQDYNLLNYNYASRRSNKTRDKLSLEVMKK